MSNPHARETIHDEYKYLKSIQAVRERCTPVFELARENQLQFFDVDFSKAPALIRVLAESIESQCKGDFTSIPPHGRWQHFEMDGFDRLDIILMPKEEKWPPDKDEATRRIIELFIVSVLLDAGAGNAWTFESREGKRYSRSEGLAVASFEMFTAGMFSSDVSKPMQVDATGLEKLAPNEMKRGFQISDTNPMDGVEGRIALLHNLSKALYANKEYFGQAARPGFILDYIRGHKEAKNDGSKVIIPLTVLWDVLIEGLAPVWPKGRKTVGDVEIGDAWPLHVKGEETIIPFHKLTQWMTYSLMVPLKRLQNIEFSGEELLTGLPEYRNGGLLVDFGVLTLKPTCVQKGLAAVQEQNTLQGPAQLGESVPTFKAEDEVVVEWRAVTVGFLDYLLLEVNRYLGLTDSLEKLTLAQMLEAGSWKLGRQVAAERRPVTKGPPIMIVSDGTVF